MIQLLKLIKQKKAVREYRSKLIPNHKLKKIIDAGVWSSSIHGFQPWRFVAITKKGTILKISNLLLSKSQRMGIGARVLLNSSAQTIANSSVLIIVYRTNEFVGMANKFRKEYLRIAELSEIESIGAAIQNMLLVAESLQIGSCWLITSLFCEKEINKIVEENKRMMAILTLGYPLRKNKRSKRKSKKDAIRIL